MEEGSLLQEALDNKNSLSNSLQIDVFLLNFQSSDPHEWIRLTSLCVQLNRSIQAINYPWLSGGDGPVFGLHQSDGNPCLRACLDYGVSVDDEWKLVGHLLELSKKNPVAVECWDLDDGQILLIEGSHELPSWVDEIGPAHCRHRCWIVDGMVNLIKPTYQDGTSNPLPLGLKDSFDCFGSDSHALVSIEENVTKCIIEACRRVEDKKLYHRTAVVLPRNVLHLAQQRPDLIHAACCAFTSIPSNISPNNYEDWVWTSFPLGRTQYAMVRSAANSHFPTEDAIPKSYQSIEVRRLSRRCKVEGSPHLRHALQIGLRIIAGLDVLRQTPVGAVKEPPVSSKERRIEFDSHILRSCGVDDKWLTESWKAGPNHSQFDLTAILDCPVFQHEVSGHYTPLTDMSSEAKQIERILKQDTSAISNIGTPAPNEVDDEMWMTMSEEDTHQMKTSPKSQKVESTGVDEIVNELDGGVKAFFAGSAFVDGVANESLKRPVKVNPQVFFSILKETVNEDTPSFSVEDPYFFDDDFDVSNPDQEVLEAMEAMDTELRSKLKGDATDGDEQTIENLLKSLEASGGAPNPLHNILREMGVEPPTIEDD